MKTGKNNIRKRRDLLIGLMRFIIGAILTWLGVHLFAKSRDPHVCVNNGICRGCGEFDLCILPLAMSAKQKTENREQNWGHVRKSQAHSSEKRNVSPDKGIE